MIHSADQDGEQLVVVCGGRAAGGTLYDAVRSEHAPLLPGRASCRSCGFVYTDRRVCPALMLAAAGILFSPIGSG